MKRWLTVGGLLMLAAWLPYLVAELHSDPAEKRGRVVAESDGTDSLPSAVAGAAAEVPTAPMVREEPQVPAQPNPQPAAAPSARAPAEPSRREAPSAPAHGDPEATADEAEPEAPPPSASGPTELLKHAYETQPRDPLWAKDAESKITGLFAAKEMPADMLQAATCRRAVCRVQLHWTSEHAAAFLRVHQGIIQEFGTDLAISPLAEEEGEASRRVDLYLVRKGYTLADFGK
jgi:hypothetical protein